jgi:hypothetical protein
METDTTLQQKFERFHQQNPHVYRHIISLVREARANGVRRIGMSLIIDRIRWDHLIQTKGDTFKINQNYASRYTRLLLDEHPEWEDMFETRSLRCA